MITSWTSPTMQLLNRIGPVGASLRIGENITLCDFLFACMSRLNQSLQKGKVKPYKTSYKTAKYFHHLKGRGYRDCVLEAYSRLLRWWKYLCCFICVTLLRALHVVINVYTLCFKKSQMLTDFNNICWECSWVNLQQTGIFLSLHGKTYAWILCTVKR